MQIVTTLLAALSPQPTVGPSLLLIILIFAAMLVGFALHLAAAYWAYKDATKRDMESPTIWPIIIILAGPLAFFSYLIIRD